VRSTDHDDAAIGGQRDRGRGASLNQFIALLRPDTATAGEHPCRPGLTLVGPPADDGNVAVGGERDGRALAGTSPSGDAAQLVALLRPDAATAREHPRRTGGAKAEGYRLIPRVVARPPNDGGVAVGGER